MKREEAIRFIEGTKERDEDYFKALQNSLIDDMEFMIRRWKEGRFYDSDAGNIGSSLSKLLLAKKQVEALENQLEVLKGIED